MRDEEIRVLLVGQSPTNFLRLQNSLERRHCRCERARSFDEALQILENETPDIVLSATIHRPGGAFSITDRLAGTGASLFYAYPVEDGCWWLPAIERGERCFGSPAMRPRKFASVLSRMVREIRARKRLALGLVPTRKAKPAKTAILAFPKAAG